MAAAWPLDLYILCATRTLSTVLAACDGCTLHTAVDTVIVSMLPSPLALLRSCTAVQQSLNGTY
jgi:hypothetical protein